MTRELQSERNVSISHGPASSGARRRQQGVALLVMVLVVLVASTSALLKQLGQRVTGYGDTAQNQAVLRQAKQALIQYAVIYPEIYSGEDRVPGPGYLPCPDQTGDGDGEDNCSDGAGITGSTLGRLPTRDLGLEPLVDAGGEKLWYAVSQSFKKHQSSRHVLNSETRGTLRVDDEDDIVAVVIAPGAPLSGQDRRHGTAEVAALMAGDTTYLGAVADQYLEDGNAISGDAAYVTGSTVAHSPLHCTDNSLSREESRLRCFNDELITLTRRELMVAVEARVANDVRGVLEAYRATSGGALPWLAPFTDPKRGGRHSDEFGLDGYGIAGRHTGVGSPTVLADNDVQFEQARVQVGARVWNTTDGSWGTVTEVMASALRVNDLRGGEENDFDRGDRYYVDGNSIALTGVAITASGVVPDPHCDCTVLSADADLERMGLVSGDVMENSTAGFSAVIVKVDGNEAWLKTAPDAGLAPGDTWRVRSGLGVVSGLDVAGSETALKDQAMNSPANGFTAAGIQPGYVVQNLTDGSRQWVSEIPDNQTLTLETPKGGVNNRFMNGDSYLVSPSQPVVGVRAGTPPVHESGKPFATDFMMRWSLLEEDGNIIFPPDPGAPDTYVDGLRNWITSSLEYSDVNDPAYADFTTDGSYADAVHANRQTLCIWVAINVADCIGKFTDDEFLAATAQVVSQSGAIHSIVDRGTRFYAAGVAVGAKVRNVTQGRDGIVYLTAAGTGSPGDYTRNTLQVVAIADGNPAFTVNAGDQLRILVASRRMSATVIANGATNPALNKTCRIGADFESYVEPGDTIRLSGSGGPVGRIETVSGDCVTYTDLQGGAVTRINSGSSFRIYYDFVQRREWQFNIRMAGANGRDNNGIGIVEPASPFGPRRRNVCRGFGNNCTEKYKTNLYNAENGPAISFVDYEGATELGSASVTIPATGAAKGSLLVGGMDYLLIADDDANNTPSGYAGDYTEAEMLPRWFLRNRWHEYIFISYSNTLTPHAQIANPGHDCLSATDCLQINVSSSPPALIKNNLNAIILMAGPELPSQNRAAGGIPQYLEDQNADAHTGDPLFTRAPATNTFNDQLIAITPK